MFVWTGADSSPGGWPSARGRCSCASLAFPAAPPAGRRRHCSFRGCVSVFVLVLSAEQRVPARFPFKSLSCALACRSAGSTTRSAPTVSPTGPGPEPPTPMGGPCANAEGGSARVSSRVPGFPAIAVSPRGRGLWPGQREERRGGNRRVRFLGARGPTLRLPWYFSHFYLNTWAPHLFSCFRASVFPALTHPGVTDRVSGPGPLSPSVGKPRARPRRERACARQRPAPEAGALRADGHAPTCLALRDPDSGGRGGEYCRLGRHAQADFV